MTIEDDIAIHDEKEDGIYIVDVFDKENFIQHAAFDEFQVAKDWIHTLPNKYTCVCTPFILNKPDAGKREKGDLQ